MHVFKDGDLIIAVGAYGTQARYIRKITKCSINDDHLHCTEDKSLGSSHHGWPLDQIFVVLPAGESLDNMKLDMEEITIKLHYKNE